MKTTLSFFCLLLFSNAAFSQQIDAGAFRFGGLLILADKKKIVEKWDKPKLARPNYECGFFSEKEQGKPYYQLLYTDFNYIGNEEEGYTLELVTFNDTSKLSISYNGKVLNSRTSVADFQRVFETYQTPEKSGEEDVIFLYLKTGDDGIRFVFENGFLIKWEYWAPC